MDVNYLINSIDTKAERDDLLKKYEYSKKEIKRREIKNIFESFKEFFKEGRLFKFKENEHSITAMYRGHNIKLDMDIYKNLDSPEFKVYGFIKMYDAKKYDFSAKAVYTTELPLHTADCTEEEKMVQDTTFYRDFIKGEITYTFKYSVSGKDDEYLSMRDLLLAL